MHENNVHKESYINITNYCYFENAVFEAVRWILRVYKIDVSRRDVRVVLLGKATDGCLSCRDLHAII